MQKIAQPPINPLLRDREERDFFPGFILAVIALLVIIAGARHLTGVDTVDGGTAWEYQLVKAFTSGGLEYPKPAPLSDPSVLDDPARAAAAFEQLERQNARLANIKFRVNTGASTPCPT